MPALLEKQRSPRRVLMNVVNFNERSCEKYRRYFDAYLDNELLVETNQDVLQHLSSCVECARILEGRARVKQAVRSAVTSEDAPPQLAASLRAHLGARRSSFHWSTVRWVIAATAVVVLAVAGVERSRWEVSISSGDGG